MALFRKALFSKFLQKGLQLALNCACLAVVGCSKNNLEHVFPSAHDILMRSVYTQAFSYRKQNWVIDEQR